MTRRVGTASQDLPLGEEKRAAVQAMFDAIAPRYDAVNSAMSLGLDTMWRRRTTRLLEIRPGSRVLDLACGTGDFLRELARAGHNGVGADLSGGMLAHARTAGAPVMQADAVALPCPRASFDGVVSGFALRNFADLAAVFAELGRVVRPGGRIALLDVSEPEHRLLRAGNAIWFKRIVPRIGGLVSDKAAYRYLPNSLAYLPGSEELIEMVGAGGFMSVARRQLSGGLVQVITGTRAR